MTIKKRDFEIQKQILQIKNEIILKFELAIRRYSIESIEDKFPDRQDGETGKRTDGRIVHGLADCRQIDSCGVYLTGCRIRDQFHSTWSRTLHELASHLTS